MATQVLGDLVAQMAADTATWKRDLGKAAAQLNASSARMNRSLKSIDAGFQRVKRTILILAGPVVIGALIKKNIDLGDSFAKMNAKTGVSVETLSKWAFGADLAGQSSAVLEKGLIRLAANMRDAVITPTAEGARAFAELGIAVVDNAGKLRSSEAVFEEVATKFAQMEDGAQKGAIAVKLFGRAGADLIPMLNNLAATNAEAIRTGQIISTEFAKSSEQFNDSVNRMGKSVDILTRTIAGPMIGVLNDWIERLNMLTGAQDRFSTSVMRRELAQLEGELALVVAGQGAFADATGLGGDQLERQAELIERIAALRAAIAKDETAAAARQQTAAGGRFAPAIETIGGRGGKSAAETEREKLATRLQGVRDFLSSETALMQQAFVDRGVLLAEARNAELVTEQEFKTLFEVLEFDHQAKLTEITAAEAEKRKAVEQRVQNTIASMRANVFDQAIGLLRTLAGDSRAAAVALIALEKGRAIAQTIINTQVAAIRAFAELGPVAGAAAAARIKTLGAVSVGIIAAQGLAEAGNVGGGGAAAGSFANPVRTQPVGGGGGGPGFGAGGGGGEAGPSVVVIVNGDVLGNVDREFIEGTLVPGFQDFLDRDGVLFKSSSRQALEARST